VTLAAIINSGREGGFRMTTKKDENPGLVQRLTIRLIVNAGALYVAAWLVPGIHLEGWKAILLAALIFGIVNTLIKHYVCTFHSARYDFAPLSGQLPDTKCKDSNQAASLCPQLFDSGPHPWIVHPCHQCGHVVLDGMVCPDARTGFCHRQFLVGLDRCPNRQRDQFYSHQDTPVETT